jgi:hypothetical protein
VAAWVLTVLDEHAQSSVAAAANVIRFTSILLMESAVRLGCVHVRIGHAD